jgi:hypothetical protein
MHDLALARLAWVVIVRKEGSGPRSFGLERKDLIQTVGEVACTDLAGKYQSNIAVQRYLADRRLLFILDNCEHLLDACAALALRLRGD